MQCSGGLPCCVGFRHPFDPSTFDMEIENIYNEQDIGFSSNALWNSVSTLFKS